jgi:hypothetical protein
MYVYCVYPAILKGPKQLPNCLKKAETSIVLIVFNGVICDVSAYTVSIFIHPSRDGALLCDWVWRAAGGHPHRFPHNNFSSVYGIFTKLGHMIPLWKGKNPIYFGVIRSKVTVTINIIFNNRAVSAR